MKAVAIILAAGEARRMAHPKALIEHEGGKSFLQSLASTFGKAGCSVIGVVGKDSEAVREQHPGLEMVEAEREGRVIAGAFNLASRERLWGRYWGCEEEHPFLHFHVCLYHSVDECIQAGRKVFEPGAGGDVNRSERS